MKITIASFTEACELLRKPEQFEHVISINDPGEHPPELVFLHSAHAHVLVTHFRDIVEPLRNHPEAPSLGNMRGILSFGSSIRTDERVLVHCGAGYSRSPAAALAMLASSKPRTPDGARAAMAELLEICPRCAPNPIMTVYADDLLGFAGELVRVRAEHLLTNNQGHRGPIR